MKRLFNILFFLFFTSFIFAQEETRVIDSLESVLRTQQGTERIKTMIQMVWAFYDVSFDDGINWGEKARQLAHDSCDVELEAQAIYAMGVQYGYHNDLDLAQDYLKEAYDLFAQVGNETKAFDALWNQAYFELILGNMDTASVAFQKVLTMAERIQDSMAYALAGFNLGVIQYQRNDFEGAIAAFKSSRKYYEAFNDSAAMAMTDVNLATCYGECGRNAEAKALFSSVIPRLEALKEYDDLLNAYKNYGLLFERDHINYDSAYYYFEKALEVTALEGLSPQDRQTMGNTKADVLVELGNVAYQRKGFQQAVNYYEEALAFELQERGLEVVRQMEVPILYKGNELKTPLRLDLLVNDRVIVELKSVEDMRPVFTKQLLTYLKLLDKHIGILVNFNTNNLRDSIKRYVR